MHKKKHGSLWQSKHGSKIIENDLDHLGRWLKNGSLKDFQPASITGRVSESDTLSESLAQHSETPV
jgi:hypothetical protein